MHIITASIKHQRDSFHLLAYLGGTAYGTGAVVEWTPMWFLTSLFVSLLVAHRILVLLRNRPSWVVYALSLLLVAIGTQIIGKFWLGPYQLGFAMTRPAAGLPWSVDLLPITVGFVLLGHAMAAHMRTFTFSTWGFCLSAALFFGLHFVSSNVMDLNNRRYGEPVTSTLKALAGIYFCLSICALLARFDLTARTLSYVGRATLFVLIFHYPIQMAAFARIDRMIGQPLLAALASLVISVLGSLAFWELTVRYPGLRRLIR